MKITKELLKQIIAEEVQNVLQEQEVSPETWEPHVKSVEVEMKMVFPTDFRKKLKNALAAMKPQPTSKQADSIIRDYAVKIKAKTTKSKPAPTTKADPKRVEMVNKYATAAGKKLTPDQANKMAIDYDALVKAGKGHEALSQLKMKLGVK